MTACIPSEGFPKKVLTRFIAKLAGGPVGKWGFNTLLPPIPRR